MDGLQTLRRAAFTFPAIDNHAHGLLLESHRDAIPFEALFEAEGDAMNDVPCTIPALQAVTQMGKVLGLTEPSWDDIKRVRSETEYTKLCEVYMTPTKIAGLLLDDGLGGVAEMAHDWTWHARFGCKVWRVVRIETSAEVFITFLVHTTRSDLGRLGYLGGHNETRRHSDPRIFC